MPPVPKKTTTSLTGIATQLAALQATLDEREIRANESRINTAVELGQIKATCTNTNGRVKKLELWKMFLIGGATVFGLVSGLVWLGTDAKVRDIVDQQLAKKYVLVPKP